MVILDIQKNKVEMVKVTQRLGVFTVGIVSSFALPQEARQNGKYVPGKIAELARAALSKRRLDKEKIVLFLPDRLIISREFTHNKNTRENLSALSILEAEAILHKPTSEYTISTYEYGKRLTIDGIYKSGLYVVKKKDLDEYTDAFREYKLKLVRVLPPIYAYSLMMLNVIHQSNDKGLFDKVVAGIDLGAARTMVSVICQQTVLYERGMGGIFDDIIAHISTQLHIDADTANEFFLRNGLDENSEGYTENPNLFYEVRTLFASAIQEIFRSLGLILSTERLELEHIYLSGIPSTVPGINEFISSLGGAKSAFVKDLINPKIIKFNTRFLDINKYINILGGTFVSQKTSADFLSVKVKTKSQTVDRKVIIMVAVITAAAMAIAPLYYFALAERGKQDKQTIQKYSTIYSMLNQISLTQTKIAAQTRDTQKLFSVKTRGNKVLEKLFETLGLRDNIVTLDYSVANKAVELTLRVSDFNTYVLIRNAFDQSKYFQISVPFTAKLQADGSYIVRGRVTVLEGAYE